MVQRATDAVAQRAGEEEELQMVQRAEIEGLETETEDASNSDSAEMEASESEAEAASDADAVQMMAAPRDGGLPAQLRAGIEGLSGMALGDVTVQRNSSAPAAVGAHAFARGNDIHLAPGQERHLPHEAWHVVQQRQGRVPATGAVAGVAINDDPGLEQEADAMGARAQAAGAVETAAR